MKKVSGYGNHNKAYNIGNCNIQSCFLNPNGLTDLPEILNFHLWCDDPSNEIQNLILKKRTVHF